MRDANPDLNQQLDLRSVNSWMLKLEDVSTAEMAEVDYQKYQLLIVRKPLTAHHYYQPVAHAGCSSFKKSLLRRWPK